MLMTTAINIMPPEKTKCVYFQFPTVNKKLFGPGNYGEALVIDVAVLKCRVATDHA